VFHSHIWNLAVRGLDLSSHPGIANFVGTVEANGGYFTPPKKYAYQLRYVSGSASGWNMNFKGLAQYGAEG
jgi:hypothetical protein